MEILEPENTYLKSKTVLDGLQSVNLKTGKQATESIQAKAKGGRGRGGQGKEDEDRRGLDDNTKQSSICAIGAPDRRDTEKCI